MKNFAISLFVVIFYLAFAFSYIPSARDAVLAPVLMVLMYIAIAPVVFAICFWFLRYIDKREVVYSKGTDENLYVYTKSSHHNKIVYKVTKIDDKSFERISDKLLGYYLDFEQTSQNPLILKKANQTISMYLKHDTIFIEFENMSNERLILNIW